MKAGVIGKIEGDFESLDSYETTVEDRGFELSTCVDVRRGHIDLTAGDELIAQSGRILDQDVAKIKEFDVEDREITINERPEKITQFTEFVIVPGELVVVEGSDGTFAFDILAELTDTKIERASFDLDTYAEQHSDADPWKCGFTEAPGNAQNGTVYGENVLEDPEMRDVLEKSNKTQLGLELKQNGHHMKTEVTQSGYVRVLRPSNYSSDQFVEFLLNDVWKVLE